MMELAETISHPLVERPPYRWWVLANLVLVSVVVPGIAWNDGANEVEAHKRGLQEGLRYAREHSAHTVGMWFKKVWLLWRPPVYGYDGLSLSVAAMRFMWLVFYLFTLGFGAYGFVKLWQSPARTIILLPLLVMICFSIPYILTFTDTRYRLPMEGFAIFYAMVGLESLLRRAMKLNGPPLINQTILAGTSR